MLQRVHSPVHRAQDLDCDGESGVSVILPVRYTRHIIFDEPYRETPEQDYDKILCLHEGRMAEFGSPKELLAMEGSMFRSLAQSNTHRAGAGAGAGNGNGVHSGNEGMMSLRATAEP